MKNSFLRPRRSVSQPKKMAPSTAPVRYALPARPTSALLKCSAGLSFSAPATVPASVTSRPSRIQVMPSAATTNVWKRLHGRRSSRAGMSVSTMSADAAGTTIPTERRSVGLRSLTPSAQQEHRLLAEQVPEPPGRVKAQRRAPGVERHGAFHLGTGVVAQRAEILDGAEMDVRRIPPRIGQ